MAPTSKFERLLFAQFIHSEGLLASSHFFHADSTSLHANRRLTFTPFSDHSSHRRHYSLYWTSNFYSHYTWWCIKEVMDLLEGVGNSRSSSLWIWDRIYYSLHRPGLCWLVEAPWGRWQNFQDGDWGGHQVPLKVSGTLLEGSVI